MLDEQSVQFSRAMVAYLDGTHLQNFSGVLESGKPRTKYSANFARSGLAIEMDRFAHRCNRRVHDVLSAAVPKTNRRRTDYGVGSDSRDKRYKTGSRCGNHALDSATTARLSNARKAARWPRRFLRPLYACVLESAGALALWILLPGLERRTIFLDGSANTKRPVRVEC